MKLTTVHFIKSWADHTQDGPMHLFELECNNWQTLCGKGIYLDGLATYGREEQNLEEGIKSLILPVTCEECLKKLKEKIKGGK